MIKKPVYAHLVEFYINVQIVPLPGNRKETTPCQQWCVTFKELNRSHYNQ